MDFSDNDLFNINRQNTVKDYFFCTLAILSLPDLYYPLSMPLTLFLPHLYFFTVAPSSLSDRWFIELQADSVVNECEMWGRSDNALMPLRVQRPALPTHLFHYCYHYLAYSFYAVFGDTNTF